jgi:hypothetical protein
MKTLNFTIEQFLNESIDNQEMNFLRGGGEPIDLTIPPKGMG